MTGRLSAIGLVGRGIAAIGAALWIVSSFLTLYTGDFPSLSLWEISRYVDIVMVVLAAIALVIVVASVFVAAEPLMVAVAVIAGYLLSFSATRVMELNPEVDIGLGGYLAVAGGVLLTVGAVVSIVPSLAAAQSAARLDFLDGEPPGETPACEAGWYDDPAGEATFRYWDGYRWSDGTVTT